MLRRAVGLDQPHVEIEFALRDRRAVVHGDGQRIAGSLWMLHQRAQDGGGGEAAERAYKGKVIRAGAPLPPAVTGGDTRGLVEQVREFGENQFLLVATL